MAWGDQGKVIRRNVTDQIQTIASIGAFTAPIPFNPLTTVGYLSGFWLYTPLANQTATHGTGTTVLQAGSQQMQMRIVSRIQILLQRSVNLVDVRGITLGDLAYIQSGRRSNRETRGVVHGYGWSVAGVAPATNQFPFNWPTLDNSLFGLANQYVPYLQYNTNAATFGLAFSAYVPVSEYLIWPNAVVGQIQGVDVTADKSREFGLIYMQSDQQNVTPVVTLSAAYGTSFETSLLTVTGNDTAAIANQQWTLESEFYDVPPDPRDRPDALMSRYAISRTEQDIAVSGQAASIRHRPAGLLLAVIYRAYNDTTNRGTIVDLTQTPTTNLQFKSGITDIKINKNMNQIAYQNFDAYGFTPPGIAVLDFRDDWTLTQSIDTGEVVEVRSDWANLPASVTRLSYTEIRALNIRRPTLPQPTAA